MVRSTLPSSVILLLKVQTNPFFLRVVAVLMVQFTSFLFFFLAMMPMMILFVWWCCIVISLLTIASAASQSCHAWLLFKLGQISQNKKKNTCSPFDSFLDHDLSLGPSFSSSLYYCSSSKQGLLFCPFFGWLRKKGLYVLIAECLYGWVGVWELILDHIVLFLLFGVKLGG